MSQRIMTNAYFSKIKLIFFAFSFSFIVLTGLNKYTRHYSVQAESMISCITVTSNLPMNHVNHPCYMSNRSNKSWISWLSGESKSTHLHFLDLIELIHYSFH